MKNVNDASNSEPPAPTGMQCGLHVKISRDLRSALNAEARATDATRDEIIERLLIDHYDQNPRYLGLRKGSRGRVAAANKTRWIPPLEPELLHLKKAEYRGRSASTYEGVYPHGDRWAVIVQPDRDSPLKCRYGSYESEIDAARVATWALMGLPFENEEQFLTPSQVRALQPGQSIDDLRRVQIPQGRSEPVPEGIHFRDLIRRRPDPHKRGRKSHSQFEGVQAHKRHWIVRLKQDGRWAIHGHYQNEIDAAKVATKLIRDRERQTRDRFMD